MTTHSLNHCPYCATIGFFDGVHLGHQFVIQRLKALARARGMRSMVVTFDQHPRQVVDAGYVPQTITPPQEKLRLLRATGADRIEVLHFDRRMAAMSAREFMQKVLSEQLGVKCLLIGYDNRFGHNRTEGFSDYAEYGKEMGIEVVENSPTDIDGMRVSSSLIRRLLAEGDVAEAARCLGRRFRVGGSVAHGFQEGRKLGFPTANIAPCCDSQTLPRPGVYATRVSIEHGEWLTAMTNVGTNPTFCREKLTLEAHIIGGFHDDIYDRHIEVEFCQRLRDEQRFDSTEQLRRQLERDRELTIAVTK